MKEIKILELFGGIGAIRKAFERLNIPHKVVDYVEIDKYAVKSYNAMFNENFECQDITNWDKDIDIDFIMHGSPCQDFSVAGKQAGGDLGSGTRSSLMYETIRIVGKIRPKYVLWENVKNLLSKKHKHNFDAYIETMNALGYNSYYQVLNAKDYGIPQNRERVYTISIRKDIDKGNFKFPEKEELKLRLKDLLEDEVDEKYYLDDAKIEKITNSNFMQEKKRIQEKEYSDTILARDWKDPKCVRIGGIFDTEKSTHQAGSIYDKEGLSPTLDVMQGGWRQPSIIIKNATQKGYDEAIDGDAINLSYPDSKTRRGRVGHQVSQTIQCNDSMGVVLKSKDIRLKSLVDKTKFEEGKVLNMDLYNQTTNENISQCLTEPHHNTQRLFDGYRIRKLTPKECWRLMGFDDKDFDKAEKVNSNTQLYKQAGNSIVVNVLEKILLNLFKEI